jgi:hypothetical protein
MSTIEICDLCSEPFETIARDRAEGFRGFRNRLTQPLRRKTGFTRAHLVNGWPTPFTQHDWIDLHEDCYTAVFDAAREMVEATRAG